MGRASRNVNGTVLLFADNMTDSLEKAISETARRRSVQEEFNKEHGITPKSVTRKLEDDLRIADPLGIDGDDIDDDELGTSNSELGTNLGIRPMEPLQPSSKTKKKASRYSKRAENAELSETIGVTPTASRAKRGTPGKQNIEDLERQMKEAAARLDFEEAARLRDIIRDMQD